jgi:DNA replication factor GINS
MIGLDDLRKVVLSERETGRLTQVPQDLFERARAAVSSLLAKIYAIEDPLSDEARTLIEETVSIRETARDIFVIRSKKILALAEAQAEGSHIYRDEIKKMIPQEQEMFDRISGAVGTCQGALLGTAAPSLSVQHDAVPAAAEDYGPAPAPAAQSPQPALSPPYTVVRVLADMEAFMGVDGRIYALAKGDIVTMPERNAEVLAGRNIVLNMNLSK